ncbi:peroxiredoxin [Crocinitomicaceae bacterium]|nr:peroxiredoxin [Crocinitomicaceae bacterium]
MKTGEKCRQFKAVNQDGVSFDSRDLIGRKKTVIFFYPKDFTPGCTKEVCEFRDQYEGFKELDCEVIGISSDSSKSHLAFYNKYNLNYHLLSDPKNAIRKLFGVPKNLFGLMPGRVTYVIDKDGTVIGIHNSLTNSTSHIAFALDCIKTKS